MKTLYLVRHAKSSKEDPTLEDWERPLIANGVERATKVAKALRRKKIHPDKIISSHAFRALNTAVIFAISLDYPVNEIGISYDIYEKTSKNIFDFLKKQDDAAHSIMIFGHNPEFTDLYNLLTADTIKNLRTSSVACIEFDTQNWSKIDAKKGHCAFLEIGKQAKS